MKRNIGLKTSASDAKANILRGMLKHSGLYSKSALGRTAFPDYDFRKPQGAAFAVAKIVREMEGDGLVHFVVGIMVGRGYGLTTKGREAAAQLSPKGGQDVVEAS